MAAGQKCPRASLAAGQRRPSGKDAVLPAANGGAQGRRMAEHKGGGDLMRFCGMDLGLEGGSTGVSWPARAAPVAGDCHRRAAERSDGRRARGIEISERIGVR
jgi:hypothetical protein